MLKHLQLETTNICNAVCVFCPHDRFKKFGTMTEELYIKILEDASHYNLNTFAPMLTGEPFCDKNFMKRVIYAREMLPKTVIRIFTNGSLMTEWDIRMLAQLGGIDIDVSLNGASIRARKSLMDLTDYAEVKRKLDLMWEVALRPVVCMLWFPTLTTLDLTTFGTIKNSLGIRFQSFGGEMYPYKRKVATCCNRVTDYLTVLYNGKVNLCCFDPFGKVEFGDLNTQTLEEVWNSKLHKKYLNKHKANRGQELLVCQSCTEGA